ncbi:MAG: hypothetical protein R3C20_05815 [Planctomycetaceae bacterium]
MERYSNMRVNPAKSVGFNAVESADRITSPIIFVVAENEELSNNDNVEAVHKGLLERGVPSAYHVIQGCWRLSRGLRGSDAVGGGVVPEASIV